MAFKTNDIPIKEIKDLKLIETLYVCLEYENELLGDITRLSLNILT